MMRIMIPRFLVVLLVLTVDAHQVASQLTPSYLPALRNNDPSFAPLVVALGSSFLFVIFFAFYLRRCPDGNLTIADQPAAAATVNYPPDEPRGIDSKLLDTFPILMYSNLKDLKLSGSVPLACAVCTCEFKPYDMLQLLPKCNHLFHPHCIKPWLASHVTCPVCRAVLNSEEEVAVVIRIEANEPPEEQEVGDRSVRRTTATEVSCGERGLRRCHSTGHSLDLRLREEYMRKEIMGWSTPTNHEVFQGRRQDEGSSRGRLFLSG